jgi:hypothetical protein
MRRRAGWARLRRAAAFSRSDDDEDDAALAVAMENGPKVLIHTFYCFSYPLGGFVVDIVRQQCHELPALQASRLLELDRKAATLFG